jgi:hypothetical protein
LPRSPKRLARLLFEKSQCFRFEYPIDILVELCLRKIKKIVLKHLLIRVDEDCPARPSASPNYCLKTQMLSC